MRCSCCVWRTCFHVSSRWHPFFAFVAVLVLFEKGPGLYCKRFASFSDSLFPSPNRAGQPGMRLDVYGRPIVIAQPKIEWLQFSLPGSLLDSRSIPRLTQINPQPFHRRTLLCCLLLWVSTCRRCRCRWLCTYFPKIGTCRFLLVRARSLLLPGGQGRLSFIGHSAGAVIIRAALTSPSLMPALGRLHMFVSLGSPHLGTVYGSSGLVRTGMWAMKRWGGVCVLPSSLLLLLCARR